MKITMLVAADATAYQWLAVIPDAGHLHAACQVHTLSNRIRETRKRA
jgi:hypothetical protein